MKPQPPSTIYLMQGDLFTEPAGVFEIHKHETGAENQKIRDKNVKHFSRQCRILFDALMSGDQITSIDCVKRFNIMDFRRRCCDIIENGFQIDEWMSEKTRFKIKYMNWETQVYNATVWEQKYGEKYK